MGVEVYNERKKMRMKQMVEVKNAWKNEGNLMNSRSAKKKKKQKKTKTNKKKLKFLPP